MLLPKKLPVISWATIKMIIGALRSTIFVTWRIALIIKGPNKRWPGILKNFPKKRPTGNINRIIKQSIIDPVKFYITVGNERVARSRLATIINTIIRKVLGQQ